MLRVWKCACVRARTCGCTGTRGCVGVGAVVDVATTVGARGSGTPVVVAMGAGTAVPRPSMPAPVPAPPVLYAWPVAVVAVVASNLTVVPDRGKAENNSGNNSSGWVFGLISSACLHARPLGCTVRAGERMDSI